MKIAIVGAGAIGGLLGVRLALSGEDVTFIARGPNLAAIKAHGMRLIMEDKSELHAKGLRACQSMQEAGPQDVVLLTVKAHGVGPIAADIGALCHEGTSIVTMQNGIPWWYFYQHGGALAGTHIESADPGGLIAKSIDPARVIGSVVYPAANLVRPGVVEHLEGMRFSLGEPSGETTPRMQGVAQALIKAGFRAPATNDIRSEIWLKIWGNSSFNPISALTHATLVDICQFPETRALAGAMMAEAEAIAAKLDVKMKVSIERRIAGAEKIGAHKTSMLQDIEQGRPIELEALVGTVLELGRLTAVPTPAIAAVYACAKLLAKTLDAAKSPLRVGG